MKKQSIYILFEGIKEKESIRRYDEFYFMNKPFVFERFKKFLYQKDLYKEMFWIQKVRNVCKETFYYLFYRLI